MSYLDDLQQLVEAVHLLFQHCGQGVEAALAVRLEPAMQHFYTLVTVRPTYRSLSDLHTGHCQTHAGHC